MSLKELCAYETPSVAELQNFLLADRRPTGHVNQVWPNVYIGNECVLFFPIQMEIQRKCTELQMFSVFMFCQGCGTRQAYAVQYGDHTHCECC